MGKYLILVGAVAAAALGYLWVMPAYTGLVDAEIQANQAWAHVELACKQRLELVQSALEIIGSRVPPGGDTFHAVTKLSNQAEGATLTDEMLESAERLSQFKSTQDDLSRAVERLLAEVDRYPDLKANANVQNLKIQLTDAEKRIQSERVRYSEASRAYDEQVMRYPRRLIARLFGFGPKAYFAADAH